MDIRAPIIVTLGHIDAGKTTLLDSIRGTSVAKAEAGGITQHVGASFVPKKVIEKICKDLLEAYKIKLTIPGLLFIDTPGHHAFFTMRKRGGAVADLAILVIDINKGFEEQTDESLTILKEFKVPFVTVATKIDKIHGWNKVKTSSFLESFAKQRDFAKEELERKIYKIVAQFAERGFNAERFDRIEDFTKTVAIVPCSGITGEGISELLMVLSGLAQIYLKDRLELSKIGRGNILEVKEVLGLGTTVDAVLYDGKIEQGDFIVVGGKEPIITKIRALLRPKPLKELRTEKKFENVKKVSAAAGIKIVAPGLEKAIAGMPFIVIKKESEIEKAKEMIKKEVEEVEFEKEMDGVILKADTLGSLEALIKLAREKEIPVKAASVGSVTKKDLVQADTTKDEKLKAILCFNVKISEENKKMAESLGIKIFQNNIIYRLIEAYEEWYKQIKQKEIKRKLEKLVWPAKIKLLPGFVFRQSKPAIVGIEVIIGKIKPGIKLIRKDGKEIGEIEQIQKQGQNLPEAKKGDKVAISINGAVIGRNVKEGEILYSLVPKTHFDVWKNEMYWNLSQEELELLEKIRNIENV